MNIVYAMTRNHYHKILPSVRSLIEHNPDAKIYILAEDDIVPDLPCEATIINVSGQEYFLPNNCVNYSNQFKYINLLKVVLPSLLPKLQKVIWLDIDTIICQDLADLWKSDVRGLWFAAVPEFRGKYKPFGDLYYNMGVAVINLQQMRRDRIELVMAEYLRAVPQPWADQDAWNKFGLERGKAAALDVRFNENMMTGYTSDPVIVHYCAVGDWYENRSVYRHEYLDRYR